MEITFYTNTILSDEIKSLVWNELGWELIADFYECIKLENSQKSTSFGDYFLGNNPDADWKQYCKDYGLKWKKAYEFGTFTEKDCVNAAALVDAIFEVNGLGEIDFQIDMNGIRNVSECYKRYYQKRLKFYRNKLEKANK